MGWFRTNSSSSRWRCPICAVSIDEGRQRIRDVRHRSPRLEEEAERYASRAADQDQFFCQSAFARRSAMTSSASAVGTPELQMLAHLPHVSLTANCEVCRQREKPSLFLEFRQLRESGQSLLVGDPTIHCSLTEVCWLETARENIHGDVDELLVPIHKACAKFRSGILLWHMGQPV
jgi:hypothetical protein